jgi:hypothetical protein
MTRLLATAGVLASLEAVAFAQGAPGSDISIYAFDPDQATAPISTVEGPGVKIGEGTVLRPVFGLETGVVSNVFYKNDNPQAAGLLRLLAQIGTGSFGRDRMTANDGDAGVALPTWQYRADLRLSYDQMLSNDSTVTNTASLGSFPSGLGVGATFRGLVWPGRTVTFGFNEDYVRLIRAANFETDADTNRDINTVALNLLVHPAGRSLSGYVYASNTIDVFERSQQQFANRQLTTFGLHPMWRWLPQTTVYADVSYGLNSGIGSASLKASSQPFTAIAGIATLLTEKLTLNVQGGYTYASYSAGPGYSDFIADVAFGYRYSPLGRVVATWDLQNSDSVNANFYRENVFRIWWQQLLAPFVLMAQPEVHLRTYNGMYIPGIMGVGGGMAPSTRDDTIISVIGGAHYNFRNWIAATLDYHFSQVVTDFRYMVATSPTPLDPGYVRHELLLGIRVAM